MLDFLKFSTRSPKKGVIQIYPSFLVKKSSDLMIRGGDFYAIWVEELGKWSTDEFDAIALIDRELRKHVDEFKKKMDDSVIQVQVSYLYDSASGAVDSWHKYCRTQMFDNFHPLDETLIFSNMESKKEDYASKRLPYPLEKGDYSSWDKLIGTLYPESERHKLEWAIGSIVNGDSKELQKFLVLYGAQGTGKSTILNIILKLFDGYCSTFDAKALGMSSNVFALEAFRTNPLVAIQQDGDLSRIEDNTRLNSLVSHEYMTVNEKFKSTYETKFHSFLFMGTNKPVKITDAKSGLLRRLIDVSPSGKKINITEYRQLLKQIDFELGAIAWHCKEVYEADPHAYDDYVPLSMMDASNDFYNFISDSYYIFHKDDGTSLKAAWEMYQTYCEDARVAYPMSRRVFKEELKNYFKVYQERAYIPETGTRVRSYYSGFDIDKFENPQKSPVEEIEKTSWLEFGANPSMFDAIAQNYPAQYANQNGTPNKKWANVTTVLKDLDSTKLHYIKVPYEHIVIDFDLTDATGEKSLERNLKEASKWPPTYAELSKSGKGIHLHYIYTGGDPEKLSRVYAPNVEIKVFTGDSSLRRQLTQCNDLQIANISSGLPLKGDSPMVQMTDVKSEKALIRRIYKGLRKEYSPYTKPSIDFIKKDMDAAYAAGFSYDVTKLRPLIFEFAAGSTHNADYCTRQVGKMKFRSKDIEEQEIKEQIVTEATSGSKDEFVIFDCEVFPNLLLVNWKILGKGMPIMRWINPTPQQIEELFSYKLIGFNNRRYDNHILYGRLLGYSNAKIYELSQRIISKKDKNAFFGPAYNVSYTDIYDYCAKKQSLKKWEVELGIHHQELGLPWDKPVPEDKWPLVSEYCDNDVLATEAVFYATQADFQARLILSDLTGLTPNDTTNSQSTRLIFGTNRHPQNDFNYRNLGDPDVTIDKNAHAELRKRVKDKEYFLFDDQGRPIFKGYNYNKGVSLYRGREIGEGGNVYAEPGIYTNVALLDVASMHPTSLIEELLFGDHYTKRFAELKEARLAIKHEDWDKAETLMDGKLKPYIEKCKSGDIKSSDLAYALKIVINSVYGLTSAKFDNPFRDPRNVDNIVAKRGALFMENLKHEVQKQGFTVAHIKTDSIKIPNATPEIIQFVMDYGKAYGYDFEHEATYEKMCLVNDAVYIAKYANTGKWTATGTQFQVPYVFKTLFSREPIKFSDLCETKSVTSALYLDFNEGLPDVSEYEKERKAAISKLNKAQKNYGDYCRNVQSLERGLRKLQEADKTIDLEEDIALQRKQIEEFDKLARDAKVSIDSLPIKIAELDKKIAPGHDYKFIGRVGLFSPVLEGGGLLCREQKGEYYAATGSKGYHWVESETLDGDMSKIDMRYYKHLVDEAADAVSQYGDLEWFRS